MTADIINLRNARKQKARAERDAAAAANRRAFGRPKAEKQKTAAERAKAERALKGHRLEPRDD